jgi:hypothetical protein
VRGALVAAQAATFVLLAAMFFADGQWRLGAAQLCLAVVTGLIYL